MRERKTETETETERQTTDRDRQTTDRRQTDSRQTEEETETDREELLVCTHNLTPMPSLLAHTLSLSFPLSLSHTKVGGGGRMDWMQAGGGPISHLVH